MTRPHPALQIFVVAWLGLQIALPIRGFLADRIESYGTFSWNMYATHYQCYGRYTLHHPDGTTRTFDHVLAFNRSEGAGRVTHRDRLPRFHRWMCETIAAAGDLARLEGWLECTLDDRPRVPLIEPGVDLCTAENSGVRRP